MTDDFNEELFSEPDFLFLDSDIVSISEQDISEGKTGVFFTVDHAAKQTRYFRFDDSESAAIRHSEQIVAVSSDGTVKLQSRISPKFRINTTPRGRRIGPNVSVQLYNSQELVILDWPTGQLDFSCNSGDSFYYLKERREGLSVFEDTRKVRLTYSSYSYYRCT